MKKFLSYLMFFVMLMFFGGCSTTTADFLTLPTGEIVSAATDRFGSWERVEVARVAGEVSRNQLELAKINATPKNPEPQLNINNVDEMESYERIKMNEYLAESNKMLGKVAIALAEKDKPAVVTTTPFPKGAFAEGFESFGKGVKEAGNTPATIALSTGFALKQLLGSADQGARVDSGGGDVEITTKKTVIETSGSESSVVNSPDQTSSSSTENLLAE